MAPRDKHESSSEFRQILDKLEIVHDIKSDVKLLKQNHDTLKESQDKTELDIKTLYDKKASKSDMEKIDVKIIDHIKGHGNWIIPLATCLITLAGTYFVMKG